VDGNCSEFAYEIKGKEDYWRTKRRNWCSSSRRQGRYRPSYFGSHIWHRPPRLWTREAV